MSGVGENIDRLNSTVRTLLSMVVVAGLTAAAWYGYHFYLRGEIELQQHKQTIAEQQQEINTLNDKVQAQAVAMRLLKKDHRLAHIHVLEQWQQNGQPFTKFRWVEINDDNQAITQPREFVVEGTVIKVDGWIVKFQDEFVEQGDALRGTSICLFRRLHGEYPRPDNVHVLDAEGRVPGAYREGEVTAFEQKIWGNFWSLATDTQKAGALGIRAAHGVVVYLPVQAGKRYKVTLRASDGLTFTPDGDAMPTITQPVDVLTASGSNHWPVPRNQPTPVPVAPTNSPTQPQNIQAGFWERIGSEGRVVRPN